MEDKAYDHLENIIEILRQKNKYIKEYGNNYEDINDLKKELTK